MLYYVFVCLFVLLLNFTLYHNYFKDTIFLNTEQILTHYKHIPVHVPVCPIRSIKT